MNPSLFLIASTAGLLVASTSSQEVSVRRLDRRSGASALSIVEPIPTIDGLQVSLIDGAVERTDLVPWDGIARLEPPDNAALERRIQDGVELGTLVWRGRERLRRGDARLAADAFDRAGGRLEVAGLLGGLLDRSVIEGRLRAEVALGRSERILGEAIVAGEFLGQAGGRFDGVAFGPEVVDTRTGLVPAAPPVGDLEALTRFDDFMRTHPTSDREAMRRRSLWRSLLRAEAAPADLGRPSADDEGAMFLWHLSRLDDPDAKAREAARKVLLRGDRDRADWTRIWSRFFAGRSAIAHAAGEADLLRGVLDLLHVIADEGPVPPALRREATDLVVETLERLDRDAEAAVFESLSPRRPRGRRPLEASP